MSICFHPQSTNEEESAIYFSTSDSHEGSTTSPSSSSLHNSPQHSQNTKTKATNYTLTVKNLSYTKTMSLFSTTFPFLPLLHKPKSIPILNSVSFTARSSELLAVVGPSGTGKSTLLGVISGRATSNNSKNFDPETISVNGRYIREPSQLRKLCGFVPQEDNLLPLLTVKETLIFGAKFSLRGMSCQERDERVERLMRELGLLGVANTFVGDEDCRGISGGERKRVSIGVEMLNDPGILLLDEPTSGLDSTSALQVVELLSMVAREKQRTVVLSIHQPSFRILQYVSNFLILSSGRVVHNGSLRALEETISEAGIQIPIRLNALEFAMEIVQALEDHSNSKPCHSNIEPLSLPSWQDQDQDQEEHYNNIAEKTVKFFSSNLFEIAFLCSRFWKIIYRTKQLLLARTMQALVGGFGLASVYIKVSKTEEGIAERLGLFAFSLSFLLSSTVEALPIYLQERKVLMKEASRGAYRVSSYLIANTLVFSPFLFLVAILFAVPIYWIVGLNPSLSAFAFFALVVWQIVLMASSLVLFLSAVSPDFVSGNSLICTVLGAFFLFSGYFIPKEIIPKYWLFMYYVSLYRYPLDSLLTNEYWSVRDECFSWRQDIGVKDSEHCLLTGYGVLKSRGLDNDPRFINVGIMFGFFLVYRLLCWIVLSRRVSTTSL